MSDLRPTPTLRRATAGDAVEILRLFDEAIAWFVSVGNTGQWGSEPATGQERWEERATRWAAGPDTWIAQLPDTGEVCGALVLGEALEYVPAATEPELYVQTLIGSRDPRAKGTGRLLLAFAEQQAADRGLGLLRLDCYAGGTGDLVRYYESVGFTPTETFRVGEWPGQVLTRRVPYSEE